MILWGGYVRATGSGAGCGAHWPLCNGEVVPRSPEAATIIEFGHRVSSALLGFMAVALVVAAFRVYPRGSGVRRAAAAAGLLVVVEALIGAGLVHFEYVAFDPRIARAYWMAAHLANTFLLLAAGTLTAWRAGVVSGQWPVGSGQSPGGSFGGQRPVASGQSPGGSLGGQRPVSSGQWPEGASRGVAEWAGRRPAATVVALAATLVLGVSGAITALGDTLAIHGGLDPAENAVVATLVGLRLYHPLLACAVLVVVAWTTFVVRTEAGGPHRAHARRFVTAAFGLFVIQMLVGLVNVALRAPVGLQIVHLLITDLIWIALVLTAATSEVAGGGAGRDPSTPRRGNADPTRLGYRPARARNDK